ncbi:MULTISPECIES: tyrosine-protein phosphatase [Clostridium]|uniref:tyrosine-protein phosphatase n=1 Tax=Clostridium TaxID=1485 RepID=UPI00069F517A|nr:MULTISPECIES: CpsB/CapC family capsule biosynthesis tyrosine phosphatase [Clostridium]KOF57312.1 exopolysaccharide biosynthesis protein [Clostridium sp. DMHC 10]MCD2347501.1 exopolysaccharide biosynthesis protein [Clostridium guangxiense]
MIDTHCHIIPGIDDGAKDIETSIKMLKIAEKDGIKTIIATPHYYRNKYECNIEDAKNHLDELKELARNEGISVKIVQGQEIFLDKYTVDLYKNGTIGTINNSKYILVETSFVGSKPKDVLENIYEIKLLGLTPILAHPERYGFIIQDNSSINEFIKEGCLFQITSSSITGIFGKDVKKTSENLIKSGICNFIGSDAHTTGRRSPRMKEALEEVRKLNENAYESIEKNSEAVISNKELDIKMELVKKKRRFFPFL